MTAANRPAENASRRQFLQTSAAAVVGGTLAGSLAVPTVHAAGSDALKYALIGCGGRGSGAALNAMHADPTNKLTVMCDVFPDVLTKSYGALQKQLGSQF